MSNKFLGLRFHHFKVSSKYGAQLDLHAQSKADALYTGAELLDEPIENLTVTKPDEWQ